MSNMVPKESKKKFSLSRFYKPLLYIGMALAVYLFFLAISPVYVADEVVAEIVYLIVVTITEITAKIKASKK